MTLPRELLLVAGLLAPAAVAVGVWLYLRRRRRLARALGDPHLALRVQGADLGRAPAPRLALVLLGAMGLGAAVADPRWGQPGAGDEVQGGPIVLVVDVSLSMLAEDVQPTRLAAVRRAIRELVRAVDGRPVGLVAFAGRAYTLTPPTTDPGALELFVDAMDPGIVTQTGSSLELAVRQAASLLASGPDRGGAIVLFTDGDALDARESVDELSRLAGRAGIPIFAVGVGTSAGAPVPDLDFRTGTVRGPARGPDGQVSISRLQDEVLRSIAAASSGAYVTLSERGAVARLSAELDRARTGSAGGERDTRPPRYAWFAAAALILLTLEPAAARRRGAP